MIMSIILTFFGLSCLASIVTFAACVASARADRIQQHAFADFAPSLETSNPESTIAEGSTSLVGNNQLALNP